MRAADVEKKYSHQYIVIFDHLELRIHGHIRPSRAGNDFLHTPHRLRPRGSFLRRGIIFPPNPNFPPCFPPNFLLLDEPTTHLDVTAREALEDALQGFAGTLCVVSHDIEFVRNVAATIIAMTPPGITRYS